jgi:hypothetical protein
VLGGLGAYLALSRPGKIVPDLPPLARYVAAAEGDFRKIQECVRRNE